MSKNICIANQKGGVGKTTTAIHLAYGLSENNKKVLLIDMDPQGNSTIGLGLKKEYLSPTIYEALLEISNIKSSIYFTRKNNLDIIPSNIHLSAFEIESFEKEDKDKLLKKILEDIDSVYNYIIIDCPPSLGMLTINSLNASNYLIIPALCEYYTIDGLSQLGNIYSIIKENSNTGLNVMGVLVSMLDENIDYYTEVYNKLKAKFNNKIFKSIIPRDYNIAKASSMGITVWELNPKSKASQAFKNFIKEVIDYD
ncbi:MAG: AAA family ATPase [Candidatus Hydrogenedentota bacterium]